MGREDAEMGKSRPQRIETASYVVLWSAALKTVVIVELTVPWEENTGLAFERKKIKYQERTEKSWEGGSQPSPVEVEERQSRDVHSIVTPPRGCIRKKGMKHPRTGGPD
ncbi:hypothetical protein Bbelb_393370 [Branchiostoma belcheri]|nr:hypothetical protein Bbelb_393370 [Branchiostoma belcheri]